MTRLYIPALGDELKLTADWTFDLYHESRNESLFGALGLTYKGDDWNHKHKPVQVTLPAGTVLKVSRIYIRLGQNNFNSVTFYSKGMKGQIPTWDSKRIARSDTGRVMRTVAVRFWAKLADVNTIEFEAAK